MKLFTKTIPALVAIAFVTAGPAAAYTISDINNGVDSATVNFSAEDGVVTLTGSVEHLIEKNLLEDAASKLDGIEEVRNFVSIH